MNKIVSFLSGGKRHGGGAQSIQVSLIKELSKRKITCMLFDTSDGSVYNELVSLKIDFIFVNIDVKTNFSNHLTSNDLLIVFNTNLLGNLFRFRNSNCKILVWEIYYPWVKRFVLYRDMPFRYYSDRFEKYLINEIVSQQAFFFIDNLGKEAVEKKIDLHIDDNHFLPIPIEIRDIVKTTYQKNIFVISYVGRSVDWKIFPFLKILSDATNYNGIKEIVFHIVCDNIDVFKSKIPIEISEKIKLVFFENLSKLELNKLLVQSDLHFAMGTACLDGAVLEVPTVLIDFSSKEFPHNYLYKWIFESRFLNLGQNLNYDVIYDRGTHSFKSLIHLLEEKRSEIGYKCRQYVSNNYNIELVVDKILNYSQSATLKPKDLTKSLMINYLLFRYAIRTWMRSKK